MINSSFWNHVDAVLVINLDERKDRWEAFKSATSQLIPSDKIHRVSATMGRQLPGYGKLPWFRGRKRDLTWAARGGCTLSHRSACLIAKENNWDNILILEDDVELLPNFQEIIKQLPQLLWDSGFAWDVCFLGYTEPQKPFKILAKTANCELVQFSGCNATHAYLLNSSARDWIITQLPEPDQIWQWTARYRAIDRWYRRNLSRNFVVTALSNSLFNQSYGFSDIECRKKSLTDEVCVTNISVQSKPKGLFNWHLKMKVLKNRMLLAYDYLRAISKRLNGF